jgi:hypothetical protein
MGTISGSDGVFKQNSPPIGPFSSISTLAKSLRNLLATADSAAPSKAPDLAELPSLFAAFRASGQGHTPPARTHETKLDGSKLELSNPPDRGSPARCRLVRAGRDGAGVVWRPRRHDLRSSHKTHGDRPDRQLRRSLDLVSRQRPRPVRARQGHRPLGARGACDRHDARRRHSRLGRLATFPLAIQPH